MQKAAHGILAGMAGATALNAATYADMILRGRPASSAPAQTVEEATMRAGLEIPGTGDERGNRVEGLGALAGIAAGVLTGAAAGQLRGTVRKLGPVLGPAAIAAAAMATTDASMAALGVTDPRSWDAASWLSDAVPHLAYGLVTWLLLAG
jgi:hypothetical protein